ncbi:XAC2610-related protein [Pseudoduganella armeniaca]|uniref:VCBS repeat-containing protein n=1 Tax=Pseudoduganella armeniaca TaxID=2072590 RepID=A0A2R4CDH4_9BURK|nr:hypothetical protein [Pseudoduganella armeniaca]AVR97518.1 hypothetical protein C9I28_19115 [Pseudoduganella armeniaca]
MKTLIRIGALLACLAAGALARADEAAAPQPAWCEQRVRTADFAFAAYATQEDDDWSTIHGIRVVDRKTGTTVQEIQVDDALPTRREVAELVQVVDANFDGRPDLAVPYNDGGAGPNFVNQFYLFDPRRGQFALDEVLSELSQPSIHPDATITSGSRGGCCQHSSARYRYIKGRLALVEEVDESISADGKWVETTTRRLVNGKWRRRFQRVPLRG